ncbi:11057_t:CDS:2 [Diversispora eburnea]|uniref:11057_t:CDS:1 n=1 Tax=Diversispora eburnea TaxID=1213867 RepID=A0A9N9ACD8_9GLOM|nr:11057_t:CDS:2 [Diversispora eburnea]
MNRIQESKVLLDETRKRLKEERDKRQKKLEEVIEIEEEMDRLMKYEKSLEERISTEITELMSLDTQFEDGKGIEEVIEKIKEIKKMKNEFVEERKVTTRGIAKFLRNRWDEREQELNKRIEDLQEKEDALFDKKRRIFWKLYGQGVKLEMTEELMERIQTLTEIIDESDFEGDFYEWVLNQEERKRKSCDFRVEEKSTHEQQLKERNKRLKEKEKGLCPLNGKECTDSEQEESSKNAEKWENLTESYNRKNVRSNTKLCKECIGPMEKERNEEYCKECITKGNYGQKLFQKEVKRRKPYEMNRDKEIVENKVIITRIIEVKKCEECKENLPESGICPKCVNNDTKILIYKTCSNFWVPGRNNRVWNVKCAYMDDRSRIAEATGKEVNDLYEAMKRRPLDPPNQAYKRYKEAGFTKPEGSISGQHRKYTGNNNDDKNPEKCICFMKKRAGNYLALICYHHKHAVKKRRKTLKEGNSKYKGKRNSQRRIPRLMRRI